MENIVPASLQRLRTADIMHMAGLMSASLGQEYCRVGAVHDTRRQGARLSGRIDLSHLTNEQLATLEAERAGGDSKRHHFMPEVEVKSPTSWISHCQCSPQTPRLLCPHAAALLYQWLARPASFSVITASPSTAADATVTEPTRVGTSDNPYATPPGDEVAEPTRVGTSDNPPYATPPGDEAANGQPSRPSSRPLPDAPIKPALGKGAGPVVRAILTPSPSSDLHTILAQLALSELRAIAREYDIVTNGVSKQQLADLVLAKLCQPEVVRRVATTLEKSQRQLLAAITLAGGLITDEDLRGLYERFSLGQPAQLQSVLLTLQSKALLFRASFNSAQLRAGLSNSLLDIGWLVPVEVRAALRVTVPTTPFDVENGTENEPAPTVHATEPYALQADLLLIAHALDGYHLAPDGSWNEPTSTAPEGSTPARLSPDGSLAIPAPADLPPPSLLRALRMYVTGTPAFLRFTISLLLQVGVLYKDDAADPPCLRVLPNAAPLLLGPDRDATLSDLFELWLTQSSYNELYALHEHHVRLRCRSSSINMPILRSGELEAENSEARQFIIALLAQAPLQHWINFTSFSRFVYRLQPLFLQRRQRLYPAPHWWLEQEPGRPLRPLQAADWMRAEYHYLSHLLSGPLHWWGICDIAQAEDGRLLAFRLTPTATRLLADNRGARLDELTARDYSLPLDSLEIVDATELLAVCSVATWPLIEVLESFAEQASARRDRLCYRLTPRSLGMALSRGQRPALLLDLLRSIAQDAPARQGASLASLIAQVERWIASYGQVRLYTGVTLLEVADAATLRELSATTSLDQQIVLNITPTIHILKKTATERLTDDLKRRGQSPLVHDEEAYGPE